MADETDTTQVIGEVKIQTVLDPEGDLAFKWAFAGLNDMEIVGLLVVVMAKHVGRLIRLLSPRGEEDEQT